MRCTMKRVGWCAAIAVLAACSRGGHASMIPAAPSPTPAIARPAGARRVPAGLKWFRTAAEYRALAHESYAMAAERLPELTRGLAPHSWAVILDADETILDNSEYERRLFAADTVYTDATWAVWVNERAAAAIPGAVEFTKRVHALDGLVAVVTNRAQKYCDATRANLVSLGVAPDVVLCQPPNESDKNPRFERIQHGTAAAGVPALTVVEWIGDNIMDFPHLTQAARGDSAALAEFGKRYFILPNPMYGSWEQNPDR